MGHLRLLRQDERAAGSGRQRAGTIAEMQIMVRRNVMRLAPHDLIAVAMLVERLLENDADERR